MNELPVAKRTASLREVLKTLFRDGSQVRYLIPIHLVFLVLDGYAVSRVPVFTKMVIDAVELTATGVAPNFAAIILYGFAVGAGWGAAATVSHFLRETITVRLIASVQRNLYNHVQGLSLDFYQITHVGEIAARLTQDAHSAVDDFYGNATWSIWVIALLIPSMITMASYDNTLFLAFLGLMVLATVVSRWIIPLMRAKERDVRDSRGKINAAITENIATMQLIKAFANERITEERVLERIGEFVKRTLASARLRVFYRNSMVTVVGFLTPFAVLILGLWMGLSAGVIVAFYGFWRAAGNQLQTILDNVDQIMGAMASFDRIIEFYDESPLVNDRENAAPLRIERGAIRFTDVRFAYPLDPDSVVLDGVSMTLEPGKRYGVVGSSGSGKTTLGNLLLRFYDPLAGRIEIDGQDLRSVRQSSVRSQMAVVAQETMLFNGTVRENLLFARQSATDDDLWDALGAAQAGFVRELESGLGTLLGERGVRLSGGQRQRISIARAFLRNPAIIILDEATSSLDENTAAALQDSIHSLMDGRTSIVISHRLSAIEKSDAIFYLEDGSIACSGTHHELLHECAGYRTLFGLSRPESQVDLPT